MSWRAYMLLALLFCEYMDFISLLLSWWDYFQSEGEILPFEFMSNFLDMFILPLSTVSLELSL